MKTVREKRERLAAIAEALTEIYPDATCALRYAGDPWRLLVMGRLSAQCTDARVNLVSEELFRAYPTPAAMAAAPLAEIERLVKSCGLYRTKAENIRDASAMLVSEYGGELPHTMEELLRFPGVGRKIANLLLGDIFGAPAVVTDTHCIRICGRLGMYPESERDPYRVEKTLVGLIDPAISADFCHRIVQFGRDVCTARAPKCAACPLAERGLCERHLRESRAAAKAAARQTAGAGKPVGAVKPLKAGKTVGVGTEKPLKTGKTAKSVQPTAPAAAPKATGGKRAAGLGASSANATSDGRNGKSDAMGEKLRLTQAVLVEGRYDKTMLENLLDATIFTTEGFGIFKNTEKKALLRRVAETRGLIVLVDSDGGGRQIRSYLTGILPKNGVIHLYIPPIEGKERRKVHRSRAGLLGVEGIDADTLRALFAPYAVGGNTDGSNTADTFGAAGGAGGNDGTRGDTPPRQTYTKADLYERGLLGGEGSALRRRALEKRLGLPEMSSNALLDALNLLGVDLDTEPDAEEK